MHSTNKNILVGYTGFVGQSLLKNINFEFKFNSKNLDKITECPAGCNLYLSCLPATKWKVNKDVIGDINNVISILSHLQKNTYNNVYLISTIDVYGDSPQQVDENYKPNYGGLNYGSNRLSFESRILHQLKYKTYKIFRLPALYGEGLKKNIIYDLMNDNNVDQINTNSYFQWYFIDDLSKDICESIHNFPNSHIYNLFPEPIATREIIQRYFPGVVANDNDLCEYNFKTKHTTSGYIYNKDIVFEKLTWFLNYATERKSTK